MYRLLLVDDERNILRNLATYFPWEESGFHVVGQVETGTEALQFLKQQKVEVVLCDIKMPGCSGIDFAKAVRELGIAARIVFLSAYRKFEYAQEAFRYGVRDYLVKPPDFQELTASLQRIKKELDLEIEGNAASPILAQGFEDPVIRTISSYTKGNIEQACLCAAAKLVGMHPNYLSTYFKEKTGIPFSEFVMGVKMKRAAQLLGDPKNSVQQVGEMLGYSNVKNFTRAFKGFYGYPPICIRKGKCIKADVSDPSG